MKFGNTSNRRFRAVLEAVDQVIDVTPVYSTWVKFKCTSLFSFYRGHKNVVIKLIEFKLFLFILIEKAEKSNQSSFKLLKNFIILVFKFRAKYGTFS